MRITFRVRPRRTLARFSSDARARFAGRYAAGQATCPPSRPSRACGSPGAARTSRRVLGGASSEILGGANLAEVLRDGFEIEQRPRPRALERGEPAEPLSIHTSAGVPKSLDDFLAGATAAPAELGPAATTREPAGGGVEILSTPPSTWPYKSRSPGLIPRAAPAARTRVASALLRTTDLLRRRQVAASPWARPPRA